MPLPVKKKATKRQTVAKETYLLHLYISGSTLRSQRALANIIRICDDYLKDNYELLVVDIYQSPELARKEQIIATPTLIKLTPNTVCRLIGNLSNKDLVLLALDIRPIKKIDKRSLRPYADKSTMLPRYPQLTPQ